MRRYLTISCLILLVGFLSFGQLTIQQEKRLALVIGNGNYIGSTLANPENDARSMADVLQKLGFTVYEYENQTAGQMKRAIDDFGTRIKDYDVGLFYYAGHGIQAKGYNYLVPVDAVLKTEEQVEYDCVRADRVLALMETSGTKVNVIILDACRNNPFERSWTRSATGRGLAFMNAPRGTLIAYATAPGSVASDGSGENGLYTSAILESIEIPNISILEMFQNVRNNVTQKSNNEQIPWESTSLTGNFFFKSVIALSDNLNESIKSKNNEEANPLGNNQQTINEKVKSEENKLENNINNGPKQIPFNLLNSENVNNKHDVEFKDGELHTIFIDSRDNQQYNVVKIGNQIWMAENLRSTVFNDGISIPLETNKELWKNLVTPVYAFNDKVKDNKEYFGAYYNWYVVATNKLCPTGWHIPTDEEWSVLIEYLGGKKVAGEKMKDVYGFNAILAGQMNYGHFYDLGYIGSWWSATNGNFQFIMRPYKSIYNKSLGADKSWGRTVRCVKD